MRKTLLLFTGSYPYAVRAENTFLPQEIDVLRQYFERIILIPMAMGGPREPINAPNVTVDTSYAVFVSSKLRRAAYAMRGLGDPRLLREVLAKLPMFVSGPRGFVRAVRAHVDAKVAERWIRELGRQVRWTDCVLYTWWFEGATLGLATFGKRVSVPVITRAHGRDVYENRHNPPQIPFRGLSLEKIDLVFSASRAGARYLAERYPAFQHKIRISLLGVEDPGFVSSASTDGIFRIVSCSVLVPVKRIDLMIRGIAALGRAHSERRFQWTHIGVGPERASLVSLANSMMPQNVEYHLLDYPGKAGLYDYYRRTPVDLFINTSESEGTSVAIMEAISVGIPALATAVGGNVEIVGPENGVLVGHNPEPREIAEAIAALMRDEPRLRRLRAESREKWRREYSTRNYHHFAETIGQL